MAKTKRGIYHNLNESEYATSNTEVAFFFSSKFYLGKFMEEHKEYRIEFRERMARAMIVDGFNTDLLADIHFYKEIEKRGFRVVISDETLIKVGGMEFDNRRGIKWESVHLFALRKMTEKNTLEWFEMRVTK